jgi:hypothetical protein
MLVSKRPLKIGDTKQVITVASTSKFLSSELIQFEEKQMAVSGTNRILMKG